MALASPALARGRLWSGGGSARPRIRLARLWHAQYQSIETRERLISIYGWFTEGIDPADLKKVKALRNELG